MRRARILIYGLIAVVVVVLIVPLGVGFFYRDADVQVAVGNNDTNIAVPSGQPVHFVEVIHGQQGAEGLAVRFRFVAPAIGAKQETLSFEDVESDMKYLCETYAIPRISSLGPKPAQIVISLSDQPVAFGATDADVVQYFEAYKMSDGGCQWEIF